MTTTRSLPAPPRLTSLDVFRGITLAGMILVNNPGSWAHVFGPLRHADWNGWTLTDMVFPSFLFIVGTAITFAFDRRRAQGESRRLLLVHVFRRAVILFSLGLAYSGVSTGYINGLHPEGRHWPVVVPYFLTIFALACPWPAEADIAQYGWRRYTARTILAGFVLLAGVFVFLYYFEDFQKSGQRVPGVLQRIALCYLLASAIVLYFGVTGRIFWTAACLIGYWAILRYVSPPAGFNPPVKDPSGLLHDWLDRIVFGTHLYRERPDPEGLLSTLPAIGTTLLGVLTGDWLRSSRSPEKKAAGLFLAGVAGMVLGLILDPWIPINKKIWTSSYVLFAGGFSAYVLAFCYLLVDLDGRRRWAAPFLVLGTNAITAYVVSGLAGWLLGVAWPLRDGGTFSIKATLYERFFQPWFGYEGGSLVYALCFVLLWILVFTPLYRARVFIRI